MDSDTFNLQAGVTELQSFADKAKQTFTNNIPNYARNGFGDLSKELSRSLQKGRLELDDFSGILKNTLGSVAGKLSESLVSRPLSRAIENSAGSLLGGLFGGARAQGGPVQPHRAFLVGEQGPELFVPNQSGAIIPNGAGAAPSVNVTIQTPNPQSFWQGQAQIQGMIASAVRQASRRG